MPFTQIKWEWKSFNAHESVKVLNAYVSGLLHCVYGVRFQNLVSLWYCILQGQSIRNEIRFKLFSMGNWCFGQHVTVVTSEK